MNSTAPLYEYHITRPSASSCEGEVDLSEADNVETTLIGFAQALLHSLISNDGQTPKLSSFTFERLNGAALGVIYGQAYFERHGNSLHHLRYLILDANGAPVASGMGTTHLK